MFLVVMFEYKLKKKCFNSIFGMYHIIKRVIFGIIIHHKSIQIILQIFKNLSKMLLNIRKCL